MYERINWLTMCNLIDMRKRKFLVNYILSEIYYVKWLQICVVCGNCIHYCHVMSCYAFYTLYFFLCTTIFLVNKSCDYDTA